MARRGQKRLEKFEESCNILRLQLLYVDEVNEAGHELTKLSNQINVASGAKHEKIQEQLLQFATNNGFFFYVHQGDLTLMRAIPFKYRVDKYSKETCYETDLEQEAQLARQGSYLFELYQSPDLQSLMKVQDDRQFNILKLVHDQTQPSQLPEDSVKIRSNKKNPQRRAQSCSKIRFPFARDQMDQSELKVIDLEKSSPRRNFIHMRQLTLLHGSERSQADSKGYVMSPARSRFASGGSISTIVMSIKKKRGLLPRPGLTTHYGSNGNMLIWRAKSVQNDFHFRVNRTNGQRSNSKEPNSATRLIKPKMTNQDSSSSQGQQKPNLLNASRINSKSKSRHSKASDSKVTSGNNNKNQDSNKSDSGGSDDKSDDKGERAEKLLNMDRRHIGDKLMKKESSRMAGSFIKRAATEEGFVLKNTLLYQAPKKSVKFFNKQVSVGNVTRQLSSQDAMCRSKSFAQNIFVRQSQLLLQQHPSQSSLKGENRQIGKKSKEFQKRIDQLHMDLTSDLYGDELIEHVRKKTLYAHADMLEKIADNVKFFFENDYGKTSNQPEAYSILVNQKPEIFSESSGETFCLLDKDSMNIDVVGCTITSKSSQDELLNDSGLTPKANDMIEEEESQAEQTSYNSPEPYIFSDPNTLNASLNKQSSSSLMVARAQTMKTNNSPPFKRASQLISKKSLDLNIRLPRQVSQPITEESPVSSIMHDAFDEAVRNRQLSPGEDLIMGCRENSNTMKQNLNKIIEKHRPRGPLTTQGSFHISLKMTDTQNSPEFALGRHRQQEERPSNVTERNDKKVEYNSLLCELEAELGVNEADAEIEKDRQEKKHKRMPAFLKGQSHAVRRKRQRGLGSEKKQRSSGLSPFDKKAGPSSAIDYKEQLPEKISKLYAELSSSSDGDSVDIHLDKLKGLFKDQKKGRIRGDFRERTQNKQKLRNMSSLIDTSALGNTENITKELDFRSCSSIAVRLPYTEHKPAASKVNQRGMNLREHSPPRLSFNLNLDGFNREPSMGSGMMGSQQQLQQFPGQVLSPLNRIQQLSPVLSRQANATSSQSLMNISPPQGVANKNLYQQQGVFDEGRSLESN